MAQVNFTLTQEEVLQILAGNRDEAFKFLVEKILNQIMLVESAEQLGADKHERTDERQDYRNGTRERILHTRIGTIELEVPRHRNQPFHTMVFENYKRSEAALISAMVQMVINGVSTRKVSKVVEELCGTSFSKSAVSELCKSLDTEIEAFRNRPLGNLEAPFLMVDATYFKARENHKVISKAFMVALVIRPDGVREIIGFDVFDAEDNASWQSFFKSLKSRGLTGVNMVISDSHRAILNAITKTYPEAAWQRCQVHFLRNIVNEAPPRFQEGLRTELRNMFNAKTIEEARLIRDGIIVDYEPVAAKSMAILDKGFEDAMTVMLLPEWMRNKLRSTNLIERLNREFKRRSDVVQVFPNPESVLRLIGAVAIEQSDMLSSMKRVLGKRISLQLKAETFPRMRELAMRQQALLDAA
ncbi:MAG: IS256 family transposase [Mogibacterium sp.]|nr:IS256 family transposase [Mogibacterium sp.]